MLNLAGWGYMLEPLDASVVTVGAPEAEIVSLSAMKEFLREPADQNANDARIQSLIVSARVHAEKHTHRSLVRKPYLMVLSRFPNLYCDRTDKINLWNPPLVGPVEIKYIDINGNEQVIRSGSGFQVDFAGEPGRIAPLYGTCWPTTRARVMNAVRIFYTAGYSVAATERPDGDAETETEEQPETEEVQEIPADSQVTTYEIDRTIPNDLVNGVMQLVTHWYFNRDPVIAEPGAGGDYSILPFHVQKILDDYTYDTLSPTITAEF